jgi:hypothetical protein
MKRNEQTSKRVASIAATILRMDIPTDDLWIMGSDRKWWRLSITWKDVRDVAASALTQATDRRDDIGFDPRDGGKIGREFIPKSPQVRKAMKGKLGKRKPASSPFFPSARPPKRGP